MDKLKDVLEQFGQRWEVLSFAQKITLGTLLIGVILVGVFVFKQAQEDYDVLYADLNLTDAAAIAAKLREEKQDFKLADGGTTILVPASRKNSLVLDTVAELSGEKPVSLSQIPPVVSGDVQREWLRTLNTNAIITVLKSIRGIKEAQVIVSQPEKNLFLENDEKPRASVMLTVEPGLRLREEQIKTIKHLVAHAVPGLSPESVAVADNAGNSLEGPGGMGSMVSTAELKKKEFEDETTKKVLAVLSPVVGKENVVVSVAAMLNFDQQEAKIHRVIPSGGDENKPVGVAVSQQNQTETYSGEKKPGAGGEAGATNNLPSYASADSSGDKKDNSDYEFGKTTTNYEVSREDKTIVYAPGQIERLTVAVVMNKVLTAQETEEIKELVANAAGLDVSRGDSVDIKGFQFTQLVGADAERLSATAKEAQTQAFWLQLATVLGVSMVLLVALFLFYNLVKAPASKGQIIHVPQKVDLPEPVIIDPTQFEDPALPPPPPMPIIEAQMDPETEAMRDAIGTAIETDPSEAARLLVAYMRDF